MKPKTRNQQPQIDPIGDYLRGKFFPREHVKSTSFLRYELTTQASKM